MSKYGIVDKDKMTWLTKAGRWGITTKNAKTYKTRALAERAAAIVRKSRGGKIGVEVV